MPEWGKFLSPNNLSDFLKDMDFPATKQDLINYAEDHNAPENIIDMMHKLPDKTYESKMELVTTAVKTAI